MLPKGWRARTVADICEFQNGHGFGPEDWSDSGLPIIRIQNMNGGKNFDYYAGEVDARWLVDAGTLLFAWAGTRGVSFGPSIWRGPRGVLNQHIFKVTPKEGVDFGWLFSALRFVTDRIEKNAHGFKSTLLHVKKSDIEGQVVLVPPLMQQRSMDSVLRIWEEAIATTERLLATSRTQKQALMSNVLTGKRRVGSFRSERVRIPTPRGSVPGDWTYPRIGSIANEVSQKHSGGQAYPVLSCTKHEGLVDSLRYFKKQVFSKDLSTYKVVPKGCFAYATNHIEEGSIGYQDLYEFGLVSPMYTVFKTTDEVHDGYLYRLLKTEHFRQIFAAATNSSVDRRGSLRWNDFKKLHIPLPPMEEQLVIAELLDRADEEIELIEKQITSLRSEKTALMQQLLTGKRRVRLSEPAEAANS